MSRARLPNRRACTTFDFACTNLCYTCTYSCDASAKITELSLGNRKSDSVADTSRATPLLCARSPCSTAPIPKPFVARSVPAGQIKGAVPLFNDRDNPPDVELEASFAYALALAPA